MINQNKDWNQGKVFKSGKKFGLPLAQFLERGRCERFVYYYFDGKFGTFPILLTQPCNSQDWARLSKMSIATFFAIFCAIFFMNFNNSCGIQDLGLSESKNSIVALSLLSLIFVFRQRFYDSGHSDGRPDCKDYNQNFKGSFNKSSIKIEDKRSQ